MSTHGSRTLIAVFYREKDSAAACGDRWRVAAAVSMRMLAAAAAAMVGLGLVFVHASCVLLSHLQPEPYVQTIFIRNSRRESVSTSRYP